MVTDGGTNEHGFRYVKREPCKFTNKVINPRNRCHSTFKGCTSMSAVYIIELDGIIALKRPVYSFDIYDSIVVSYAQRRYLCYILY